jgi:putative integral membrane protein (TIGR02587 family)
LWKEPRSVVAFLTLGTPTAPADPLTRETLLAHVTHPRDFDAESDPHGWREEGRDLLRAVAAGSIVGMPLLYTMEMWCRGTTLSAWHLLAVLAASVVINFFFSLFSGFRASYSATEALSESVTAVALGMLFSAAVLALIGELTFDRAWSDVLGRVLVEAAPVSLGISFANYQVRNKSRDGADDESSKPNGADDDPERLQLRQDLTDLAATVGGATLFAYNVAPTEEIVVIAARVSPWQQLLMMLVSLLLCHMIIFAAGFRERTVHVPGPFQSPFAETVMAYAASLVVSFLLLALVGVPEAKSSLPMAVSVTVVLGLPAVVGASAGRLIT